MGFSYRLLSRSIKPDFENWRVFFSYLSLSLSLSIHLYAWPNFFVNFTRPHRNVKCSSGRWDDEWFAIEVFILHWRIVIAENAMTCANAIYQEFLKLVLKNLPRISKRFCACALLYTFEISTMSLNYSCQLFNSKILLLFFFFCFRPLCKTVFPFPDLNASINSSTIIKECLSIGR